MSVPRGVRDGHSQRYTVALLFEALHAPRSSVYAAGAEAVPTDGGKHGPKTALKDDALVEIRAVLAACRAVQPRVDRRAPGVPDACPGTSRCASGGRVRGYLAIVPVATRGSTGLYVRRGSGDRVESPLGGPGVQETGCGTS